MSRAGVEWVEAVVGQTMAESKVKNFGLTEFGRKKLSLPEQECPDPWRVGRSSAQLSLNTNASFITIIQAGVLVDRDGLGSGYHRAAGVMQDIQHAGSHS